MIVTKTPVRISLCGGGSDLPDCFRRFGTGLVVSGGISLSTFLTVRPLPPFHPYKSRVVYSEIECVASHEDLKHKAVQACLSLTGTENGVEVFHQSDIPARSGTGSSSSFVVGLLNALWAGKGVFKTPEELAAEAIHVEREMLKENVGYQDQIAASFGCLATIRFHKDGSYTHVPLGLSPEAQKDLESHLLLFFTGISRDSTTVAASYYDKMAETEDRHHALVALTEDAISSIRRADYERLAKCIDQSWRLKAMMSPQVAPPQIQTLMMKARLAGAWGGKLCGAGAGGSILLVVPPEKAFDVILAMHQEKAVHLPFSFVQLGSHVVYSNRD